MKKKITNNHYKYCVVVAYDYGDKNRGDIISRHKTYFAALKMGRKSTFWCIKDINPESWTHTAA